jgi:hypothetical protein
MENFTEMESSHGLKPATHLRETTNMVIVYTFSVCSPEAAELNHHSLPPAYHTFAGFPWNGEKVDGVEIVCLVDGVPVDDTLSLKAAQNSAADARFRAKLIKQRAQRTDV